MKVEGWCEYCGKEQLETAYWYRNNTYFERYRFGNCQHCGYEEQCMARQTNCYKVHLDLLIRARELGLVVE